MILAQRLDNGRFVARFRFDQFWHTARRKRDGEPRTFKCATDARRAAHREWLERFAALIFVNDEGVAMVETALVLPVLLIAFLGLFQLGAWQSMVSSTTWLAQAATYQQVHGGNPSAVVAANAGAFLFGAQPTLVGCTADTCTVSATMPPLFPLVGVGNFTTTSSATD